MTDLRNRASFRLIVLSVLVIFFGYFTIRLVKAASTWQEVDVNSDGQVNSTDVSLALQFLGCPSFGDCGEGVPTPTGSVATPTPAPTLPPGEWAACGDISMGTQVLSNASGLFIKTLDQTTSNNGYVYSGNLYVGVDLDMDSQTEAFGYSDLSGWQRGFIAGTMEQLENKCASAATPTLDLHYHYEYLAYGPESEHGAGEEALWPDINVPIVEGWAHDCRNLNDPDDIGKQLMYAPSRQDYTWHEHNQQPAPPHILELRPDVNPQHIIADVAQHVDIWGIQLGYLQGYVDNPDDDYTEEDFMEMLSNWVSWIKVGDPAAGHPGNSSVKIVAQMGISNWDDDVDSCPAETVEYVLTWRNRLASLIDGIVIMPGQRCQPCPDNYDPSSGFICTQDEDLIAQYQEAFDNVITAVEMVCP